LRHPFLLFLLLASPLYGWGQTTASSAAPIVVTARYQQLPATTDIRFEELKYGKTAGFIFTKDDGEATDTSVVMRVLNGGTAFNGVTYPGAYYTDGAGLPVKFHYTFAVNTTTINNNWRSYAGALAKGDNLANHSHLHGNAYNAWRAIKDPEKAAYDKLGIRMRTLVIPVDFAGYIANSLYLGYKFIGSTFASNALDGYASSIQWNDKLRVATFNPNRILASRANFDGKWMEAGQPTIQFFIDDLLAQSSNGVKLIGHAFSHGPGTTEISGFKRFVDYLMAHPNNNDRVWLAGQQEVMEYYEVRDYFLTNPSRVTKVVNGNVITYTFDPSGLPVEGLLRDFSLRLPAADLASITVSGADTASYNLSTGLVNVYLKNPAVKNPSADITPPQILTALASPTNPKVIDLVYSKSVTQTEAGFSVAGNTLTQLTGSGRHWQLHLLNNWQPTQTVTYVLQAGNAAETGNASNKVCSHLGFLVSREEVDADSLDNSRPLHFRNYLWQDLDGTYTNWGTAPYQHTIATETIAAGQEARISWRKTATDGTALGFATTDTAHEALGMAGVEAGIMLSSGNLRLLNQGADSYSGSPIAAYYGLLRKANGTIIVQSSQDGITWVNGSAFALASTAKLYVVATLRGNLNASPLTQPKIELLGSIVASPLPVTLSSFTATRHADGVTVRWRTASETNNAYFEVQHATAGQDFQTIKTVPSQGQGTLAHTYAVLHRPPAGLSYYRLRQVDNDGTATFSPVVAVASDQEVTLFPNPARTQLTLVTPAGTSSYRVRNSLGEVMLEGLVTTGTVVLNVAHLPNSIYLMEVLSPTGRTIRKFVKE
jgi:hypothetical protein